MITNQQISFNGVGKDGHETFRIDSMFYGRDHDPEERMKFAFCKTAQKPYDVAVTSVLLIFKFHFGNDFKVSSDGDMNDWAPAIKAVTEAALGYWPKWTFNEQGNLTMINVTEGVMP